MEEAIELHHGKLGLKKTNKNISVAAVPILTCLLYCKSVPLSSSTIWKCNTKSLHPFKGLMSLILLVLGQRQKTLGNLALL